MIYAFIIVNNSGQPRLAKFYKPIDIQTQQKVLQQVYGSIISQKPNQSNIISLPEVLKSKYESAEEDLQVIYRLYATLNFVVIFDRQESELGVYDLIQVFVESLNKCFTNVCEIDLVFGWETVETVLEDLIQGGMALETNPQRIIEAVDSANGQTSSGNTKTQPRESSDPVAYLRWGPINGVSASTAWSTLRSYFPTR